MYISKLIYDQTYTNLVELIEKRRKYRKLQDEFRTLFPDQENPMDQKVNVVNEAIAAKTHKFVIYNESMGQDRT